MFDEEMGNVRKGGGFLVWGWSWGRGGVVLWMWGLEVLR